MTRSRWRSPGRNLTRGDLESTPHSSASLSTRRRQRRQLLMELTCQLSRCRDETYSATSSGLISSSLRLAKIESVRERRPKRYHSHVFGAVFSKVDFAHAVT